MPTIAEQVSAELHSVEAAHIASTFPIGARVRLRTSTTDSAMVGDVVGTDGGWITVHWGADVGQTSHLPDSLTAATPGLPGASIRRCGSPLHMGDRDLPADDVHYYRRPSTGELADVCRVCVRERDRRYRAARRAGTRVATPRAINRAATPAAPTDADASASTRQFGVEVEFTGASHAAVIRELTSRNIAAQDQSYNHRTPRGYWKLTTDSSCGSELVSPPLSGADGRGQLRRAMEGLRAAGARVTASCGVHVHVDMAGVDGPTIGRALQTYAGSQSAINWFVDRSRRINGMCRTVSPTDPYISGATRAANAGTLDTFARRMGYHERFRAVNVRAFASYGTIELRQHQGSLNARKVLAWIDFAMAIFAAAANGQTFTTDDPATLLAQLAEHGDLSGATATFLRTRAADFRARAHRGRTVAPRYPAG